MIGTTGSIFPVGKVVISHYDTSRYYRELTVSPQYVNSQKIS